MRNWLPGVLTLILCGSAVTPVSAGDHWPWKWHNRMYRPYWSAPMVFSDPIATPEDMWLPAPVTPELYDWETQYLADDVCCDDAEFAPTVTPERTPAPSPTPIPDDGFRPSTPNTPMSPSANSPTPIPTPTDVPNPTPESIEPPVPDPVAEPIRRTPPRRVPIPMDPPDVEVTPEISIPMPKEDETLPPKPGGESEVSPTPAPSESQKIEIPREEIPFPRDASRKSASPFVRRPIPGAARAWISRPDAVVR